MKIKQFNRGDHVLAKGMPATYVGRWIDVYEPSWHRLFTEEAVNDAGFLMYPHVVVIGYDIVDLDNEMVHDLVTDDEIEAVK